MVFPVVMYKCESGNIKKSELWTTDINSEYPLEVLILKLKLQYLATWCKELTHWKIPWCWERLREGGKGGARGRNGLMASSTQWTWVSAIVGTWRRTGKPGGLQSICQSIRHHWATEWNWAIVNSVVMDIGVCVSFFNYGFLSVYAQ